MSGEIRLEGYIESLSFRGQSAELPEYLLEKFDINTCKPACKVIMPNGDAIALSRWSGPKRTRTYPFARIYDTYSHGGKIVTVIPIVKDEGQDTNLDRVNFITLSWMNLMNIYVILVWYQDAEKENEKRITKQRMDNSYIIEMLQKISSYKLDAHHWNREHFERCFIPVYRKAIEAYERIAQVRGVKLHNPQVHEEFIQKVCGEGNTLDLDKFRELTLKASERSAHAEQQTVHRAEHLTEGTVKATINIRNNLGGEYHLTCDEVIWLSESSILIQESKNTSGALPSCSDIKDGLFKLLLFSHIKELYLLKETGDKIRLQFETRLRLTGKFSGSLYLPDSEEKLGGFSSQHGFNSKQRAKLSWLNEELRLLGLRGILEGRSNEA